MEIEMLQGGGNEAAYSAEGTAITRKADSFECVCGGYQVEYFCNLYEDALDKIITAQTKAILSNPSDSLVATALGCSLSQKLIPSTSDILPFKQSETPTAGSTAMTSATPTLPTVASTTAANPTQAILVIGSLA